MNTTDPVQACGFQSSRDFVTVLRKNVGVLPREFRPRLIAGAESAVSAVLPTCHRVTGGNGAASSGLPRTPLHPVNRTPVRLPGRTGATELLPAGDQLPRMR